MSAVPWLAFEWRVPEAGFGWSTPARIEGQEADPERARNDMVLEPMAGGSRRHNVPYRDTWPLRDEPLLFEKFAALATPDEVLAFTNQHGKLAEEEDAEDDAIRADESAPNTWRGYRDSIRYMRAAIGLWEAYDSDDPRKISEKLSWKDGEITFVDPDLEKLVAFGWSKHRANQKIPKGPSGLRKLAGEILQSIIDWGTWPVQPKCERVLVEGKSEFRLRFAPRTLHTALWLQFASLVTGQDTVGRHCMECGRYFILAVRKTRSDRQHCEKKCGLAKHRRLARRARELRSRGMTPRAIGAKLDVTTATVKGWLKKTERL